MTTIVLAMNMTEHVFHLTVQIVLLLSSEICCTITKDSVVLDSNRAKNEKFQLNVILLDEAWEQSYARCHTFP